MTRSALLLALAIAALPSSPARAQDPDPRRLCGRPPAGFVDLEQRIPGVRLDIRYHRADNFTGAPLPGYGAPCAWMLSSAAGALARVQARLAEKKLGLMIYDAYRPARATLGMVAWATRSGHAGWVGPYIGRRSGHNHGHTVDLTLVHADTGEPLDMGTGFDAFSPECATEKANGAVLANRLLLQEAMKAEGFKPYPVEWWHFSFPAGQTRSRDVAYGCFEAPEGSWKPPAGWERPGFAMPRDWKAAACPGS